MKLAQDNTISCANFILHFKDIMICPTKAKVRLQECAKDILWPLLYVKLMGE